MERDVVEELSRVVRVSARRRRAITRELRTHVEDSQRELELTGLSTEAAAAEARHRFGDVEEIAEEFGHTYRPSRSARFVLALGLAGGMSLGIYGIGGSFANANSPHHSKAHHAQLIHHSAASASASHHCGH